jgi:DNA modification methylase
MFSFAGDTVLDPFGGTGTTALAAIESGRSSVTYEVEAKYISLIMKKLSSARRLGSVVTFESRTTTADDSPESFAGPAKSISYANL